MSAKASPATAPADRFHGCSAVTNYDIISKLGEGTFGEVHKAKSKRSGKVVALKKILVHQERDGFPITALREIKLLKSLSHPNVLRLDEMAIERSKNKERKRAVLYMVTPYMEHDLSGLLENPQVHFSEAQIKCYMFQLLEGVRYLHASRILHRDMKAANILIDNRGVLQIADFGLARLYDDHTPKPGKGGGEAQREYTALVVTRWYRPPELLLQLRRYTTAIDMWGVGCIFGEMFKHKPILSGKSDLNQCQVIFDLVGSPTEETMPGWSSLPGCEGINKWEIRQSNLKEVFREMSPKALSLLQSLLLLDWRKRLTAIDALEHPYFTSHPLPSRPGDLPKYADSHELDRRRFRDQKAALPPAPAGGAVGQGPEGEFTDGRMDGAGAGGHRGAGWGRDYRYRGHDGRDGRGYERGLAPPPYDSRQRGPPYPPHKSGWDRRPPPPPHAYPHEDQLPPPRNAPRDDRPSRPLGPYSSSNGNSNNPRDIANVAPGLLTRPPLPDSRRREGYPTPDGVTPPPLPPPGARDPAYPRDRGGPPPLHARDRDRDKNRYLYDHHHAAPGRDGRDAYRDRGDPYRNRGGPFIDPYRDRDRVPRDRDRDRMRDADWDRTRDRDQDKRHSRGRSRSPPTLPTSSMLKGGRMRSPSGMTSNVVAAGYRRG